MRSIDNPGTRRFNNITHTKSRRLSVSLDLRNYKNRHSISSKMLRLLWHIIWLALFQSSPRGAFYGWRRLLLRTFGAQIGTGANILPSCRIWAPWNLKMGDHSCLSENVDCYSVDSIYIGSNVVVSQGASLCTASHDIGSPIMELTHSPIAIEDNVWVAARAFIGPGVTIREGAVVAACAVVAKDVESWTVVGGNPAEFIKKRVLHTST